jgi:hypothetical protein
MPQDTRRRRNRITVLSRREPYLCYRFASRCFVSLFRFAFSRSQFRFAVLVRRSGSQFRFAVPVRRSGSPFRFAVLGSPFASAVAISAAMSLRHQACIARPPRRHSARACTC